MRTLHISVLDKKATYLSRDGDIVCGNSDYVIEFAFDAEWDAYEEKIARFIWNGQYKDLTFTGTSCAVPIITNAAEVEVGVYAGELSTTTPAVIGCQKSILCKSAPPSGIPFTKGEKGDPGVGVPEVTADDNGKVLTVQDGDTVWAEPTGGGGDSLPKVTEDDNGKILIVQNGEWVIDNYGNIRETLPITLTADGWASNKQTVESASISENSTLVVSPVTESTEAYIASGIMLTEAEVGKMVFECVVPPTEDIAVLVHIIDPLITAEPFVVNLSGSLNDEYLTTDKTFAETKQAYMDGKQVTFVYKQVAFGDIVSLIVFTEVTSDAGTIHASAYHDLEGVIYRYILTFNASGAHIKTEREMPFFRFEDAGVYGSLNDNPTPVFFENGTPFIVNLKAAILRGAFQVVLPIKLSSAVTDAYFTMRTTCVGSYISGAVEAWQFAVDGALETGEIMRTVVSVMDYNGGHAVQVRSSLLNSTNPAMGS